MQQIKAAATAAKPAANPSPAPTKPPRPPLPFTPTDPTPTAPGKPHTRLGATDTPTAPSASQHAASKAADVDKHFSSGVITHDALPSSTQHAFDQHTATSEKAGGASPTVATASSAASASGAAGVKAAAADLKHQAEEEPLGSEPPKQTASTSERAGAEEQGMLRNAHDNQGRAEQPDIRAAGPSPSVSVPAEGIKLDSSSGSGRTKKSSRELEKKSSRDSRRLEPDRKPSRAKRRRSRSRSLSDSPKRYVQLEQYQEWSWGRWVKRVSIHKGMVGKDDRGEGLEGRPKGPMARGVVKGGRGEGGDHEVKEGRPRGQWPGGWSGGQRRRVRGGGSREEGSEGEGHKGEGHGESLTVGMPTASLYDNHHQQALPMANQHFGCAPWKV